MSRKYIIISILTCLSHFALSQNTIGVLINSQSAFDGYTLYTPAQYQDTYLIDNCGRVINQWQSEYSAGLAAYLLSSGQLLRAGRLPNSGFPSSGSGGVVQIFNWDGTLAWEAEVTDDNFGAHHDIEPSSYGTIFLLRWERKTMNEYIQAGKDPELIPANFWMPSVFEIRPTAMGEFDIVWEWHAFDHLVQNFDDAKDNFGEPSENPRKIDINYNDITSADWGHLNGIDFNEDRDEILLSVRNFDEVWVLDHSTTSLEAATDLGGDQGYGGQLLYRFGNESTYIEGGENQLFDGQHNAKFVEDDNGDLGIQLFSNNNQSQNPSEIIEIKPSLDSQGMYLLDENKFWISKDAEIFSSTDDVDFDSPIMSSVYDLPNGNVLINSGREANIIEVSPDGNIVWKYVGPVSLFGPNEQGSEVTGSTFIVQKYDVNDPMFDGLDTSVKAEAIELNPDLENCGLVSTVSLSDFGIRVFPTLFNESLNVENLDGRSIQLNCFNIIGSSVYKAEMTSEVQLNTAVWEPGIYFIQIQKGSTIKTVKLVKPTPP